MKSHYTILNYHTIYTLDFLGLCICIPLEQIEVFGLNTFVLTKRAWFWKGRALNITARIIHPVMPYDAQVDGWDQNVILDNSCMCRRPPNSFVHPVWNGSKGSYIIYMLGRLKNSTSQGAHPMGGPRSTLVPKHTTTMWHTHHNGFLRTYFIKTCTVHVLKRPLSN